MTRGNRNGWRSGAGQRKRVPPARRSAGRRSSLVSLSRALRIAWRSSGDAGAHGPTPDLLRDGVCAAPRRRPPLDVGRPHGSSVAAALRGGPRWRVRRTTAHALDQRRSQTRAPHSGQRTRDRSLEQRGATKWSERRPRMPAKLVARAGPRRPRRGRGEGVDDVDCNATTTKRRRQTAPDARDSRVLAGAAQWWSGSPALSSDGCRTVGDPATVMKSGGLTIFFPECGTRKHRSLSGSQRGQRRGEDIVADDGDRGPSKIMISTRSDRRQPGPSRQVWPPRYTRTGAVVHHGPQPGARRQHHDGVGPEATGELVLYTTTICLRPAEARKAFGWRIDEDDWFSAQLRRPGEGPRSLVYSYATNPADFADAG